MPRGAPPAPRAARPRPRWACAAALAAVLSGAAAGASASERGPAAPPQAVPDRAASTSAEAARADRPSAAAPSAPRTAAGIALDFPRGTGAALLRRGGTVLAVFDSSDLRNPEALRHPAVAGAVEARTLPQGLVLAFPADRVRTLDLARGPSGWVLGAGAAAPSPTPPTGTDPAALGTGAGPAPAVAIGGVPPNRVVVLRDPETGLPLLVGTTREPGRGFAGGRRAPEYDLLETGLGVAVLARSENLELQALAGRFVLSGSALSPLSLDAAAVGPVGGAAMTRCLGLPDLMPERLLARLRSQSAQLAGTGPLARAPLRRELAATMLALGLGHEAQAEMTRAAAEDADAVAARGGGALAAAAALLAGRLEEAAAGLRPEPPPGCDELALWRSLFLAQAGDPAAALPGLRAALPLLLSYPPTLRDRLLPLAADALAQAGAWPALRGLLADARLRERSPLPAAMLMEADGDADGALAAYDDTARGRDRRARAAAMRRAVELCLRTGRMDAAAAARAFAPVALVAWRGDASERDARLRLAQLLASAGDPGGALALLRQSAALFPDGAAAARMEAGRVLRAALDDAGGGAGGSPLAAVAAFQAGADLLSPEDREAAESRLVDLLVALDLPGRAAALLDGAAGRAPAGDARAEIGWRLAALRFRENDAAGARAALDATDAPGVADTLRERRAALAVVIAARGGAVVASPDPGPADPAEAEGALNRRDWAAAAKALGRHLDGRLPAAPAALDAGQQEAVLRLAAALALAGDDAGFAALRARVAGRMEGGPHAAAFARLVDSGAGPPVAALAGAAPRAAGSPAGR